MKKRIRKTGEIVDVISYNKYSNTSRNSDLDWVSYIDSEGREYEHEKGLNIYWDFDDVEEASSTDIDWEQPTEDPIAGLFYSISENQVKVAYNTFWTNVSLSFPTRTMAQNFFNCFKNLCETAKILL